MLIFLGGTAGNNNWREDFTQKLVEQGVDPADIFNPVVEHWTPEARDREEDAKEQAEIHVYYITDPKQGNPLPAYSMVEATMALYDREDTFVVFDTAGMSDHPLRMMNQTLKVLSERFPAAIISSRLDAAAVAVTYHELKGY